MRCCFFLVLEQLTTTCGDSSRLKASLPSLTVNLQRLLFFSPDQGRSDQQEGGSSGSSSQTQRSPPPLQRPQAILNLLLYLSSLYRKQDERLASHIKQRRLASGETRDDVSSSSSSSSHLSRKAELRGGEGRERLSLETYEENKTQQKKIDVEYSSTNQRNSIESEERSHHTQASTTPITARTPTPRMSASKKGCTSSLGAGGEEGPDGARRGGGGGAEQDTPVPTSSQHPTAANTDGDTNSQNRTSTSFASHNQRVGSSSLSPGIVGLNPPGASSAPPSATPPFTTPRSIRCESISSIHTDSTLVGGVYGHPPGSSSISRGRVSKHPHSSSSLLRKRDYARHQKEEEERRGLGVSSSGRPYHRLSKQQNGFEGGRRSKGGGRGRGGGGRTRGGEQEGEQQQGGPWVVEEDDEIDEEEEEEDEQEEQENAPPLHELGLVYGTGRLK